MGQTGGPVPVVSVLEYPSTCYAPSELTVLIVCFSVLFFKLNLFDSFVYKLTDFGAARELEAHEGFMSVYGTEEYLVSQILQLLKSDNIVDP